MSRLPTRARYRRGETLKAFDPNSPTKTSGMGLGLAIVKKIAT